ncbi:MAG: AbrB family transcriptional regulator [Thermococcus sp.]|uniref:AbrB family transcriptional regulator n=1 Tax=Thermococcus sp. TaxID=35749 RepID=UPI001DF50A25|nr:AbrB family transcriptional regulator [Thermococcus sp.]MBO8175424.1 AbrB family transcriptional regulator [Thermococcus sp.]
MTEQQVVEPLAKFQSRVRPQGRVMIPIYIREYFGIQDGDFVVVIIRIPDAQRRIKGRVFAVAKVYDRGVFTIPKKIREQFDLKSGDFVEILLVGYLLIKALLEKRTPIPIAATPHFEIIDENQERQLLQKPIVVA